MDSLITKNDIALFSQLNLLYVEDDPIIKDSMIRVFHNLFQSIHICDNGAEALEIFQNQPIDLIVIDIEMPKKNGLDVIKEIRKSNSTLPIIILTSFEDTKYLLEAIPLGLIDYILKTSPLEDLMGALLNAKETIFNKDKMTFINDSTYYSYNKKSIVNTLENVSEPLTYREYTLLEFLIEKEGITASFDELESILYEGSMNKQTLRNTVKKLKNKLGNKEKIKAVRDVGYQWVS